jgi:hypothetical protein
MLENSKEKHRKICRNQFFVFAVTELAPLAVKTSWDAKHASTKKAAFSL